MTEPSSWQHGWDWKVLVDLRGQYPNLFFGLGLIAGYPKSPGHDLPGYGRFFRIICQGLNKFLRIARVRLASLGPGLAKEANLWDFPKPNLGL